MASSSPLVRFFRAIWGGLNFFRRFVHLILMFVIVIVFVGLSSTTPVVVPQSAALVVAPNGALVEQLSGEPIDRAINELQGRSETQTLVRDVVKAIDEATDDDRIGALFLRLDSFGGGSLPEMRTVAAAVERFKISGKPVIAAGDSFSQAQYYLAATADEIYMHPSGALFFQGFGYFRTYFASALEKISVDWHVFKTGDFKSAFDNFVRDDMSEEEKAEGEALIAQLWAAYQADVVRHRSLEPDAVQRFADSFLTRLKLTGGDMALAAEEAGFVDALWTRDRVKARLSSIVGEDEETGSFHQVGIRDYLAAVDGTAVENPGGSGNVAVIVAAGDILDGSQPPGTIGGDSLASVIRKARLDDSVSAVVLRVDSPGGSQFASEVIMRELELLRARGTPVVVSMGGIAASGGYIISLQSDEIWAHETTITGSIGVLVMFPTYQRALERLGINVDGVGTTAWSGDFRPDRGISEEGMEIIQSSVESSYRRFIGQVAESRGLTEDAVTAVAGGRVWTGKDAVENGLVDKVGTLQDAIASAAGMAGLGDDYKVTYMEKELSFSERLLVQMFSGAARAVGPVRWSGNELTLGAALDGIRREIESLVRLNDPRNTYYHCFCDVR